MPEAHSSGALWFQNLVAPDPTLILPLLSSLTFLITLETGGDGTASMEGSRKIMMNVFRGLAVLMLPMTYFFPASLFVYWTTNNTFSILTNLVLRNEGLRRKLGMPSIQSIRTMKAKQAEEVKPSKVPGLDKLKTMMKTEATKEKEFKEGLRKGKTAASSEKELDMQPEVLSSKPRIPKKK